MILAGTLTGVQGDIRCKVLAALSTVNNLSWNWLIKAVTEGSVFIVYSLKWVHIAEVPGICNWKLDPVWQRL